MDAMLIQTRIYCSHLSSSVSASFHAQAALKVLVVEAVILNSAHGIPYSPDQACLN
jgi:hypothetical protein